MRFGPIQNKGKGKIILESSQMRPTSFESRIRGLLTNEQSDRALFEVKVDFHNFDSKVKVDGPFCSTRIKRSFQITGPFRSVPSKWLMTMTHGPWLTYQWNKYIFHPCFIFKPTDRAGSCAIEPFLFGFTFSGFSNFSTFESSLIGTNCY